MEDQEFTELLGLCSPQWTKHDYRRQTSRDVKPFTLLKIPYNGTQIKPYRSWMMPLTFEPSPANQEVVFGACDYIKHLELKKKIETMTARSIRTRNGGRFAKDEGILEEIREILSFT